MILSKKDREKLYKVINYKLQTLENQSFERDLLFVVSALILDFEELENILSKTYTTFASGKVINEILDSLSGILSSELTDKLHFEGQLQLIKSLALLADNAENLKLTLAGLHDAKLDIVQ